MHPIAQVSDFMPSIARLSLPYQNTKTMNVQQTLNYDRIAVALDYIKLHFKEQPSLEEIAEKVHLSPFHFQKLFTEWAGTSPKKFLQYISIEHAKKLLKEQSTLSETAFETGLSGTSRLHDLFINIEGMTPAEYKNGGKSLSINYSFAQTPFGNIIVASTSKGICHMAFSEDEISGFYNLQSHFPNANFKQITDSMQQNALHVFQYDIDKIARIKLHLKGTEFQLKVWETLLKIPKGKLSTYGNIAYKIEKPNASRAVGTAIGSNPVAFLIPCHRVIQASGNLGGYMWGNTRKTAIIGWEAAQIDVEKSLL
ncbi:methylated-DNA--protein-cysteine methyltransferase [Flavobacterium noncentrifugens]|uniref:methylated-DNA--[protein]-cysteine S-methyltransferase n=2 Tax=Flavobacterium noncentrifugens TaxID=1128970 RepID=A0A1G8VH65_9FLAO|nr:methylated-DNA--protein-cysteine methyltransferase [Flavobacterium noncentrifugens]SDJ65353.1 AraC family transcriptional regulator, regulatory protein of adaptative response / methylated-DNA-[protein]-cysteine methyltransferase [Flavobacterium noncentrifugens]